MPATNAIHIWDLDYHIVVVEVVKIPSGPFVNRDSGDMVSAGPVSGFIRVTQMCWWRLNALLKYFSRFRNNDQPFELLY